MPVISDSEYLSFLDTLVPLQKKNLTQYFESFVSYNKREQMHQVLAHRTRHVAVVLENNT